MKICIIGTHCSGKTSLIDKLYPHVEFSEYSFFPEPIRVIGRAGFLVNQESDDAAQLAMLAIHLRNLQEENFVSDRSLLDLYVYGKTLKNVTKSTLNFIHNMWLKNADRYDYLFHCQPEFTLVADGFRSSDKDWQLEIKKLFDIEIEHMIKSNLLKKCKIITLSGCTDARCDTVLKEVFK